MLRGGRAGQIVCRLIDRERCQDKERFMRVRLLSLSIACLLMAAGVARPQGLPPEPGSRSWYPDNNGQSAQNQPLPRTAQTPQTPQTPERPEQADTSRESQQTNQDTANQNQEAPPTPAAGTAAAAGGSGTMMGDFQGYRVRQIVTVRGATGTARVPISSRATFKLADFESPRPMDRVFFNYNFYDNMHVTGVSSTTPGFSVPNFDIHVETIGFEKTFLDGDASIGLRVPIIQTQGFDPGINDIGDLSVIFKYALINDCDTHNVLSTGLAVTAPTGKGFETISGDIHPTVLQPFLGYIDNINDNFYSYGFSSVVVPTDSRDVVLLFNDFAFGYRLYESKASCGGFLTSITPVFETHVTTPLNHRNADALISVPDLVVLVPGVQVGICHASTFNFGVGTPVTGPKPYDFEVIAQLWLRF
jgi:hypothetical protein